MEGGSAVSDWEPTPRANDARTLVLVGRTGNGKKATGNSILGRKSFKSRPSSSGVTDKCELQSTILKGGTCINVIDTPGLFYFSDGGTESLGKELVRCLEFSEGGIHAFLVVFSVRTRFSQEEGATLRILEALFGHKIIDYMIIIFTGGDDLEYMEVTLDEYLGRDCPAPLKKIIGLCRNRVVVFNNKTGDERKKNEQLQQLFAFVEMVVIENGGKPYTDKPFAESWAIEVDKLTASSKQEIDQLNRVVHTSYEVQLNGMTDMIEPKLSETAKLLEWQIEKEKAATAEAEKWALESQMSSEEEMSRLRASLENERREARVLRNSPPPPGSRAILIVFITLGLGSLFYTFIHFFSEWH